MFYVQCMRWWEYLYLPVSQRRRMWEWRLGSYDRNGTMVWGRNEEGRKREKKRWRKWMVIRCITKCTKVRSISQSDAEPVTQSQLAEQWIKPFGPAQIITCHILWFIQLLLLSWREGWFCCCFCWLSCCCWLLFAMLLSMIWFNTKVDIRKLPCCETRLHFNEIPMMSLQLLIR